MYKLNTMQGSSFFNFLTPVNYLSKKTLFRNANEIKPKRMDSYGRVLVAQSLPKEFWFREYDKRICSKQQKKEWRKMHRHQNPIYFKRIEQIQHLLVYSNRPCTQSPSKKWRKCRNLLLKKNTDISMTADMVKQKFQETLHLLIPQKSQISPQSVRCSLLSNKKLNSNINLQQTNEFKIKQTKTLNRLESNKTDYVPSLLSIDKQIKENSISQSNINNNSFIQQKDISTHQMTPRNRFLKDCCRLYGLDSHIPSINKLVFSDSIQLTESCETKSDKIENSPKSIGKSTYQQKTLLNLIKKQADYQQNKKQRQCSTSLQKNNCKIFNNRMSRVMKTYFPSPKRFNKHNFS
ncbi:unnamed protein product [Paramecium sonneborni]|uniref:Uncharacterized protein n=1 Tax=Paramecium sonneborni TaxID=65129 RepID=A0A8S1RIJ5_9CILI|nr:unnamed protein product [Paramecium sonneborni]